MNKARPLSNARAPAVLLMTRYIRAPSMRLRNASLPDDNTYNTQNKNMKKNSARTRTRFLRFATLDPSCTDRRIVKLKLNLKGRVSSVVVLPWVSLRAAATDPVTLPVGRKSRINRLDQHRPIAVLFACLLRW